MTTKSLVACAFAALTVVAIAILPITAAAQTKPRLPAGTDPGGIAIAILGPGLDYTVPAIADRLARDGEGDPIGRDFQAGDNRPFEGPDATGAKPGTAAALALVRLVERVRLVAVREHPADPAAIGRMLAFTTQSPAMISLWLDGAPSRRDWPILVEAARRFTDRLIIVPAPTDAKALAALPRLANLVLVAGDGRLVGGRAPAGVIIPKDAGQNVAGAGMSGDVAASIWVAALAARALGISPTLDAAQLARALAAMAHPQR